MIISEQTSQDEFSYVTVTICIFADAYKLVLTSYIMGVDRELSNSGFVLKNWFNNFWAWFKLSNLKKRFNLSMVDDHDFDHLPFFLSF